MQNYVFYLVDDTELKTHHPEPDPTHAELEEWAYEHGAHWGELRQRAGFLWDAIEKLDIAISSNIRFKDRISEAKIGPPWGAIEGVGYFPAKIAAELELILANRSAIENDPAYVQLVDAIDDVTGAAKSREMGFVVVRA